MLKDKLMYKILLLLLIAVSNFCFGQSDFYKEYNIAENFLRKEDYKPAHKILKDLEQKCSSKDSIYIHILMYYNYATAQIVDDYIKSQAFDSSLYYSLDLIRILEKNKPYKHPSFVMYEYKMLSNAIVSYFGLELPDSTIDLRNKMYYAHKNKLNPKFMGEYFFFTKFKSNNKNIQGVEWFEVNLDEGYLPIYSKIVYQVFSVREDGSNKDFEYEIHVKMHQTSDPMSKSYYVLTKNTKINEGEKSDTLYAYTYTKNIDYRKLQADIKKLIQAN